jgi:hypothetical protein
MAAREQGQRDHQRRRRGLLGRGRPPPGHHRKTGPTCPYARAVDETAVAEPAHLSALLRHFRDLRDGTHDGMSGFEDKQASFARAVHFLVPVAVQALDEINQHLLAGTGTVTDSGLQRDENGSWASWSLSWPEQKRAGVAPIELRAHFETGFHHPHLRGATVREWPLNVFSASDADAQLPILRAITAADLHNLVFRADFRIIPQVVREGPGAE